MKLIKIGFCQVDVSLLYKKLGFLNLLCINHFVLCNYQLTVCLSRYIILSIPL